jgi:hypothetical protein
MSQEKIWRKKIISFSNVAIQNLKIVFSFGNVAKKIWKK